MDQEPELGSIDDYLVEQPNRTVLVTVRDSMKDAGHLDGDIAVVERNAPIQPLIELPDQPVGGG